MPEVNLVYGWIWDESWFMRQLYHRNRCNGKALHVSLCVQSRGQCRNMTRWRSADVKPKSARVEDIPAASQTGSAALQDLTHEVKVKPGFIYPALQQCEASKTQWHNRKHSSAVHSQWSISVILHFIKHCRHFMVIVSQGTSRLLYYTNIQIYTCKYFKLILVKCKCKC